MKADAVNKEPLPIACKLSGLDPARRKTELSQVPGYSIGRSELDDGYEFEFAGDSEEARKLVELVLFERECCPFLEFELAFGPGPGRVALRVRGPEGLKEFVAEMAGIE